MPPALTPNAISNILEQTHDARDFKPIVQVFDLKELKSKPDADEHAKRFRVLASDGGFAAQGLFGAELNAMCANGEITKFTVLRLKEYIVNDLNGRRCVGEMELGAARGAARRDARGETRRARTETRERGIATILDGSEGGGAMRDGATDGCANGRMV